VRIAALAAGQVLAAAMTSAHEQDLRHAPRPCPDGRPIPPWRVWTCPRSVDTYIALRRRAVAEKRRKFGHDFGEGAVRLVPFKPLTHPEIERIADLMFNDLRTWLAERGITLDPTEDAPIHPQARIRSGLWHPAAAPVYCSRGGNPYRPRAARRRACSSRMAQSAQAGVST